MHHHQHRRRTSPSTSAGVVPDVEVPSTIGVTAGHGRGLSGRVWAAVRREGRWTATALVVVLGLSSFAAAGAATGAPRSVATCATLGPGAAGPAVVTIQQLVKTTPDGDFGPLTRTAVKRWQHRHHLRRTGVVDAATWAALPQRVRVTACGQPVHGSGAAVTCAVLATGAAGPAVEVLQKAVRTKADGDFGPLTAAAVRAAQARAKLRPSGIAGVATWAALGLTGTPACVTAAASRTTPVASTVPPRRGPPAGSDAGPGPVTQPSASPTEQPGPTTSQSNPPASRKLTKAQRAKRRAQRAIARQVLQLAAELLAQPKVAPAPVAHAALHFARHQVGKPYAYGAEGPKSYDCSGLVMAAYRHAGLTLPRVAADQYAAGGAQVPLDQAQPGDLLFYASDVTDPATVHHVAIYVGGGKVLDAPYTGAFVGVRPLWTDELLPVAVRPAGQLSLPLQPGASSWTVGQLQQALNRHGAQLSVDGGYGPQTVAAVNAWKARHHLPADGVVDLATWLTLR